MEISLPSSLARGEPLNFSITGSSRNIYHEQDYTQHLEILLQTAWKLFCIHERLPCRLPVSYADLSNLSHGRDSAGSRCKWQGIGKLALTGKIVIGEDGPGIIQLFFELRTFPGKNPASRLQIWQ
jgi:hypothetical protein